MQKEIQYIPRKTIGYEQRSVLVKVRTFIFKDNISNYITRYYYTALFLHFFKRDCLPF